METAEQNGFIFSGRISAKNPRWLRDHALAGTVLLPGTAFVEMALYAGKHAGCGWLEDLTLQAPYCFPRTPKCGFRSPWATWIAPGAGG